MSKIDIRGTLAKAHNNPEYEAAYNKFWTEYEKLIKVLPKNIRAYLDEMIINQLRMELISPKTEIPNWLFNLP